MSPHRVGGRGFLTRDVRLESGPHLAQSMGLDTSRELTLIGPS